MSAFDPLDGWFDKGFRVRGQKAASATRSAKRDAVRSRSGTAPASKSGVKFSASAKQKNYKSVTRGAPEVMVKITGNSSGLKTARHHLDYISRNGELELTDERGESVSGRGAVNGICQQYKAAQVPAESGRREFLHVVFSMPPGTPEKAMREAVAQFCQEEFANRRYVAALHDDKDHTHVHVCVSTRDIDRADEPRLSPKKADLARWRQGFADKLREQGIDAAASDRKIRGNWKRPEHAAVRQIRADNPGSAVFDRERAERKAAGKALMALARPETAFVGPPRGPRVPLVLEGQKNALQTAMRAGIRPENPAAAEIQKSQAAVGAAWREVSRNLQGAGEPELARQAAKLAETVERPAASRLQELYDLVEQRRERDAGHEQER